LKQLPIKLKNDLRFILLTIIFIGVLFTDTRPIFIIIDNIHDALEYHPRRLWLLIRMWNSGLLAYGIYYIFLLLAALYTVIAKAHKTVTILLLTFLTIIFAGLMISAITKYEKIKITAKTVCLNIFSMIIIPLYAFLTSFVILNRKITFVFILHI